MIRHRIKGTVLIITIWITTILAGLAITLAWQIRTESIQVENQVAAAKAEFIASGAIEYVKGNLSSASTSSGSSYEQVVLGDGYYWLIKPDLSSDRKVSFGIVDEAGKVNLNSASLEMLLKLPGMTSELAASIIDWRDRDSQVTVGGAENEHYLLLSDSYECKNSNFETVEEVLLVKGASKAILFGEDYNVNGMLDDNENDGTNSLPDDNSNGSLDMGFYNYVTVYSYEKNVDSEGSERVNVSDRRSQSKVLEVLQTVLRQDASYTAMNNIRAKQNYQNVIDVYYTSRMKYDDFEEIADKFTTTDDDELVGLINVNTAPEEVLNCLPGLESSDVDDLIRERERLDADEKDTILWVTKVLKDDKAVAIGSFITVHSYQYSADALGLCGNKKAFRRYKVVIDSADGLQTVYRKSLSHLGWPLEKEILVRLAGIQLN